MFPGNKAQKEAIRYSQVSAFLANSRKEEGRKRGGETGIIGRSVFAAKRDYRNNAKSILARSRDRNCKKGVYENESLHASGRFNFNVAPFFHAEVIIVRRRIIRPFSCGIGIVSALGCAEKFSLKERERERENFANNFVLNILK